MSKDRYIRQTTLDKIGKEGQEKLLNAKICIIGCGGLGTIAAGYLAGAGIGHIQLIDSDKPDISNLHRQVFYNENTSVTKSEALALYLKNYNPEISVSAISMMAEKSNILDIIDKSDLVLECTDNVMAKYLINDACHLKSIPMVYGAIHKYDGYVSFFKNANNEDIHLRDIFPIPNMNIPSCSESGVMNTLAGIIGLFQANEAIKFLTNAGPTLDKQLLIYDILNNNQLKLKLKKSWQEDINEHWINNDYHQTIDCQVPEITVQELLDNPTCKTIISILEIEEHRNITEATIHTPLSEIDIQNWNLEAGKSYVFYCQTGKRSSTIVSQLIELYPDIEVLSLAGGLSAFDALEDSTTL